MRYRQLFDPDGANADSKLLSRVGKNTGDRAGTAPYIYTPEIILAVNVGLVTGRPLLVRGASGSGKSSLAQAVARQLGWRYYASVITSRTQAQDLLWTFDAVRRLSDAQASLLSRRANRAEEVDGFQSWAQYIEPGVLWWAFDRGSARRRGLESREDAKMRPAQETGTQPDNARAVVLIDEIDKADPDAPNNLLVPLGSFEFMVEETGVRVQADAPPLVFITTNGERDLPPAFIRRCIILDLPDPTAERLTTIAAAHFGTNKDDIELHYKVAEQVIDFKKQEPGKPPSVASTAEYLDAIVACRELGVPRDTADETWQAIRNAVVAKQPGR